MSIHGNVPTLSYIRWTNMVIVYQDVVYQILNDYTNKAFIYWDIDSPYELISSNKKLEAKDGRFYIIFNQNGQYTIVPNSSILINFTDVATTSKEAVSNKILGFQNTLDEEIKKITTMQVDVDGLKTTVLEVQEDVVSNKTNLSILEQRANEISAEVNQITIDYSDDVEVRELRDETNKAILSIQSVLGLFSSDMNTYMEDNRLTEDETYEILAYKEEMYEKLNYMNSQVDIIISLLTEKGENEKVAKLTSLKEGLNNSVENLFTTIETACTDNVFTNNEIATIITYFGNVNIKINEMKNLIDEYIYLSLGGTLIEEIGKLIVKQDEIRLSVSKNEQSIRGALNKEKTDIQTVIINNITALDNFKIYFNETSNDNAYTTDEVEVMNLKIENIVKESISLKDKKDEIINNELLTPESKENISNIYNSLKGIHDNFLVEIDNILKDGMISTEEQIKINEFIESYSNEVNNLNEALCNAIDEIGTNGVLTDIENVDKKWAEIILDPENGIQSQVGNLYKQVNDDGGIIERLEEAEQKITPNAIINTVSGTYYSKTEIDDMVDNIEQPKSVDTVDVMYYSSTSSTSLQDGNWVTDTPTWVNGRYIWSKTVTTYTDGTTSETNPICITGSKGENGTTYYTWIKYSDYSDGSSMYDTPKNSTLYIGIASNKTSETESTDKSDYTWSKFKGADGLNGVNYYTWIKYADDADGNGLSDDPTNKEYIGFSYNQTTSTESTDPSDYKWSLIKGEDGRDGQDGQDGTSIKVLGKYDTLTELNSSHPSGNTNGDSYVVNSDLYVWTGSSFENMGQFKGEDGLTLYTWIKYSDYSDGSNMYELPTDKTEYIGIAVNKTEKTESSNKDDYVWSKFKGADGVNGKDGKSIATVVDYYRTHISDTGITNNSSGFSTTVPVMDATNKYLWSYEQIVYSDDSTTKTNARVIGVFGEDGKGIKSIVEYYAVGTSNTTAPSNFSTTIPNMTATNKYMWNYEVITYTDDTTKTTDKRVIGVFGKDGKGVESITEEYYLSASKTTQTGGSWSTTMPTWKEGYYIWTRSKITYDDNSVSYTTPVVSVILNELDDVKDQVDKNKTEIETTKQTLSTHTIALDNITSRVETTESTVTTINGEISNMENRISSAEQKITSSAIINTVTTSSNWSNQTNAINQANTTANSALEQANTNTSTISTIEQTANKINWVVTSGTSSSNMVLSSDFYNLVSKNITISGYVTFTDLAGAGKSTINGDNITSGTIKGVTIISTINNLRRVKMVNDGLYFYSDDKQSGEIHFDSNGEGTASSAKNRFLIKSLGGYVLKLLSTGDVSIEANSKLNDIYLEAKDTHVSNDLGVGAEIVCQGVGRFYSGISSDGNITTTGSVGCNSLAVNGAVSFPSSLTVNGTTTLAGTVSMQKTVGITGAVTLSSTLGVSGKTTLSTLSAGASTLSSLTVSGSSSLKTLTVSSTATISGKLTGASAGFSGNVDVTGIIYGAGNIQLDNASNYFPATGSTATANRLRLGNTYLCAVQSSSATSGVAVHFTTTSGGNGSIYAGQMYANGYNNLSDKRAKTDIKYVNVDPQTTNDEGIVSPNTNISTNDMLDFIENLPIVSYRLNDEIEEGKNETHYGFLTQDILYTKVGSELVILPIDSEEDNKDGFMRYSMDKFISFICGALQEEIKLRKELEKRINELDKNKGE